MVQSTASQYSNATVEQKPRYFLATAAGLGVAVLTLPLYRWIVAFGYHNGYYTEWPQIIMIYGFVTALVMRYVTGKQAGVRLGVLAGLVTLIQLFGSEYLLFHYLISQALIEEGYQALPLLLPPQTMLAVVAEGIMFDPARIIFWIVAIGGAVLTCIIKNLGAVPRWSAGTQQQVFSGATPKAPGLSSQSDAIPVPSLASIAPENIPAEAYVLGAPTHKYNVATGRILTTAGVFAAIGLGSGVLAYISTIGRTVLIGISLFFLALAVVRVVLLLINLDNQVLVFPNGLSITQEGKTTIFPWDQISHVYQHRLRYSVNLIPVVNIHRYTIEQANGSTVTIRRWYEKLEELGNLIHQRVTEHQLPKAFDALRRNERVDFGSLYVSREGLYDGKKLIPWPDIQNVGVWQGSLRINTKGRMFSSTHTPTISKLPNPHLFFELVYRFLDRRPS